MPPQPNQNVPRAPFAPGRSAAARIGFALFAVGLVFLLLTVVPFFWGDHNRPLWINLACMLAPAGFVIAVTATFRTARAEQRTIGRSVEEYRRTASH